MTQARRIPHLVCLITSCREPVREESAAGARGPGPAARLRWLSSLRWLASDQTSVCRARPGIIELSNHRTKPPDPNYY
ncbi:MAG: hypothetical protein OXC07_01755 [Kistimonas sp.]|nr:hypothetical protein [Kistimonas sp.]